MFTNASNSIAMGGNNVLHDVVKLNESKVFSEIFRKHICNFNVYLCKRKDSVWFNLTQVLMLIKS